MEITPREMEEKTDKTPAEIEQEAIEGNEIIAAWLGWIRREPGEYNLPNWWEPDRNDLRLKGKFRGYPHQLRFHSSWDWLMPVFKKLFNVLKLENWPTRDLKEWANAQRGRVERKLWEYAYDECTMPDLISEISDVIKWYTSNQPKKQ